jgi:hypothetical protein
MPQKKAPPRRPIDEPQIERIELTPEERATYERIAARRVADKYMPRPSKGERNG